MKRFVDIILALVLLIPATFFIVIAAIAIRLETPGMPLFAQIRIGRDCKPFRMLKLRTMRFGTPTAASHEIGSNTITRVGRFLRHTKIDELPQVFSVLVGAMSFVGPRPCLPGQTELIAARKRLGVFALRPGITGKAQAMGVDMSNPDILARIDAQYIRERNLLYDLKLIARTATGGTMYDAAAR